MCLDREKLIVLMKNEFDNNYSSFARALGVDVSQLYKFLNKGIGCGRKMISAVMAFCKNRGINFEDNFMDSDWLDDKRIVEVLKHKKEKMPPRPPSKKKRLLRKFSHLMFGINEHSTCSPEQQSLQILEGVNANEFGQEKIS